MKPDVTGNRSKVHYAPSLWSVVLIIVAVFAQSYGGRTFYFGFCEFPEKASPTIQVYISNPNSRVAYLQISTPRLSSADPGHVWERLYVTAYSSVRVSVPRDLILRGSQKSNKVLHVCSSQDISVQAIVTGPMISDGYSALPINSLGNTYLITTYFYSIPADPQQYGPYSFVVVGTAEDTFVSMELRSAGSEVVLVSYNGLTYTVGDIIEDTLFEFEAIQIQVNDSTGSDLSGTLISSNKPIAVLVGVAKTRAEEIGIDHLTDFVLPVDQLTTEYFVMSTPSRHTGDIIRITAMENGTQYSIIDDMGNAAASGFIEAYSTAEIFIPSNHAYVINGSRPIQATMIGKSCGLESNNSDGDTYLLSLLSMSQGGSKYIFTTMSALNDSPFTHFLTIIAETEDMSHLVINENLVTSVGWLNFWNTEISGLYIELPPGISTYVVRSTTGRKFIGYLTEIAFNEAVTLSLHNPKGPPEDPDQGLFEKTAEEIGISSNSLGCISPSKKSHCFHKCLAERDYCAGIHYDKAARICCLLNDEDVINSSRISYPESELYQWSGDIRYCNV